MSIAQKASLKGAFFVLNLYLKIFRVLYNNQNIKKQEGFLMGAWGHDILDNDTALDLKSDIEFYIDSGYKIEDAFKEIKKDEYFMNDNFAKLALAEFQYKYLKKVDADLDILNVIKKELCLISHWKNPEERVEKLLLFRDKVKLPTTCRSGGFCFISCP